MHGACKCGCCFCCNRLSQLPSSPRKCTLKKKGGAGTCCISPPTSRILDPVKGLSGPLPRLWSPSPLWAGAQAEGMFGTSDAVPWGGGVLYFQLTSRPISAQAGRLPSMYGSLFRLGPFWLPVRGALNSSSPLSASMRRFKSCAPQLSSVLRRWQLARLACLQWAGALP